jgi:CRP/FNR family transcriptional regulator
MTTLVDNAPPAAVSTSPHPHPLPPTVGACDAAVRQHATLVRARRRQRLALDQAPAESVYIVRSGVLGIEAAPPGKHRQLLALFYPGDIVRRSLVPELPGVTLSAMNVAEVWRLPPRGFDTLLAASAETNTHAQWQLANQHARATLHGSMVGGLCGDERFASLLIELGLRLGTTAATGVTIESPLSRSDIADYLALNPDTLSRISSRFKARGLLLPARSGRIVLPDWKGLCAASPVAATLLALHAPRSA